MDKQERLGLESMSKYNIMVALLPVVALLLVACQDSLQDRREVEEKSFAVGDIATLRVDNFAGDVTIRGGWDGTIRVIATKRARLDSDLGRISVTMSQEGGGLTVESDKPSGLSNVSVDLEIDVPTATRLEVNLGAGEVLIGDVVGETDVNSGAGNIDYQGRPQGDCRFDLGAGNIILRLPADVDVEVDLKGIGQTQIDFPVSRSANMVGGRVSGTIGSGAEGTIHADVGTGNINVVRE